MALRQDRRECFKFAQPFLNAVCENPCGCIIKTILDKELFFHTFHSHCCVGDRFLKAEEIKDVNELGLRMRRQRHRLDMTLQQLAVSSGVSVGYISQLERGNATPTLGTLSQIASALGVEIDYFLRKPKVADSLTRAGNRPRFSTPGSSIEYEQIGADFPEHELTSFVMNIPPGYESELVKHVGEEIIYILEGEISQVVGDRVYVMSTGDSLHFLGEKPHRWSNKSQATARILWVGRMQFAKQGHSLQISPTSNDTNHAVP
jgi:transcriptional regulator with XRE-family HTH domain